MFLKDNLTDKEVEELLYGISMKEENTQTADDYTELVKEKILKFYSIKGRKQLGDRIFGYLLASELIPVYTPEDRLQTWKTLIGEKTFHPTQNYT